MRTTTASVGSMAPEFELPCTRPPGSTRDNAKLGDYRGKWLVLVFYPRDFSLVCPTELTALSAQTPQLRDRGCEVLGVSCDSIDSHRRWNDMPVSQGGLGGLAFPLASDKDGAVASAYGVYIKHQRASLRGTFIIDPNGVLQYQVVHSVAVGRRTDVITRVLAALQTGGMCPENWDVDDATLNANSVLGPGRVVSHYRIEEEIGTGSFASVFRASDLTLERTVALKIIKHESPLSAASLLAEARAAAALNHPNICTVFAVDDSEGVPIIAMEYLPGRPLTKLVGEGPFDVQRVRKIGRQVASAMAAAHEQGVVHGDLKPANIMVADDLHAKVLDFGLSRRLRRALDMEETIVLGAAEASGVVGTPSYMSPEQASGQPMAAASDVFALGLVLYEMLIGERAFPGHNVLQILGAIRDFEPTSLTDRLPEDFAPLVGKMLLPEASQRTITMHEITEALA